MLLIPIGQEDAEVRRMPWVTWALIALNALVFLIMTTDARSRDWERTFEKRMIEMAQYWVMHPYLSLPSEVAQLLGEDRAREITEAVKAEAQKAGITGTPESQDREQRELTRLAASAMAAYRESPHYRNGFIPARPELRGLLGSMFLHAGWGHLLGNMLILFVVGPFLEDVWGRPLFGVLYLVWGTGAALTHAFVHPASIAPLVGASGAIAGVMGAFLLRMHRRRIRFLCLPIVFLPFFRFTFGSPAYLVLPLWFGQQLLAARFVPDAPIAWWAHIGGFTLGMAAALLLRLSKVEERFINPSIEREIGWQQHPGLVRAGELREKGRHEDAREEILKVLQAEPGNADAWSALYEVSFHLKQPAEEARAVTRLLELRLASGDRDLARKLIDEALGNLREHLPARFFPHAAGYFERDGDLRRAAEMYEAHLFRQPGDPAALRSAVRLAEIHAGAGRPRDARHTLAWALLHPSCTDHWRLKVETLHAEMERLAPAMTDPLGWRARLPPAPSGPADPMSMTSSRSLPRPVTATSAGVRAPAAPSAPALTAPAPAATESAATMPMAARASSRSRVDRWIWAGTGAVATVGVAALALFLLKQRREDLGPSASAALPPAGDPAPPPTARPAPPPTAAASTVRPGGPGDGASGAASTGPAAGAPDVPAPVPSFLRVTFACPFPSGHLVVKRGEIELLARTFDFGKRNGEGEGGSGLVEANVQVAPGPIELKVWLISADRSVNETTTLTSVLPEGIPKVLTLEYSGPGTLRGRLD